MPRVGDSRYYRLNITESMQVSVKPMASKVPGPRLVNVTTQVP
jgi:hypothetical protein